MNPCLSSDFTFTATPCPLVSRTRDMMSYPPARVETRNFLPRMCSKGRKVGEKGRKGRGRYEKRWRGYKCRTDETSPVMLWRFRGLRLIAIVCELTVNSSPGHGQHGGIGCAFPFCSVHPLLSLFLLRFPFFLSLLTKTNDGRVKLIMSRYFT